MRALGYDGPLYILPFDHRGSFQTKLFGWTGSLAPEQAAQITATKQVVYDGFRAAVESGVPEDRAGILVDEQFGAGILVDARRRGFATACPAEKSGQVEFDFEYGEAFADHIEMFQPTFSKVLVRYNPEGDRAMNARQATRLRRLSEYLRTASRSLFMFELLVPPEKAQLDRVNADKTVFDREYRPRLTAQTIEELQNAGVEPDVWKIEGLDRREDCEEIVRVARREGREKVGCIILGRGENELKVRAWLATASGVPGFIGFAVGRTTFWDALLMWKADTSARAAAVKRIADNYLESVNIFDGQIRGVGRR